MADACPSDRAAARAPVLQLGDLWEESDVCASGEGQSCAGEVLNRLCQVFAACAQAPNARLRRSPQRPDHASLTCYDGSHIRSHVRLIQGLGFRV